jgi:hypothetical protein
VAIRAWPALVSLDADRRLTVEHRDGSAARDLFETQVPSGSSGIWLTLAT